MTFSTVLYRFSTESWSHLMHEQDGMSEANALSGTCFVMRLNGACFSLTMALSGRRLLM